MSVDIPVSGRFNDDFRPHGIQEIRAGPDVGSMVIGMEDIHRYIVRTKKFAPQFEGALNWLKRESPDLMTGPCRGFFAGGPTPQDCVRAVVKGFDAYRATKRPA